MPSLKYECVGCGPGKRRAQMRMHSSGKPTKWCNDCMTAKIAAGRATAHKGGRTNKKNVKADLDALNEALQLGQETGAVLLNHAAKIVDFFAAQDEVIVCLHFKYRPHGGGGEMVYAVEAETTKRRSFSV